MKRLHRRHDVRIKLGEPRTHRVEVIDLQCGERRHVHLVGNSGRPAGILRLPIEGREGSVRQDPEKIDCTLPILRLGDPGLGRFAHGRRIVPINSDASVNTLLRVRKSFWT